MKEWIEIRRGDAAAYEGDIDLFREAVAFMASLKERTAKTKGRHR